MMCCTQRSEKDAAKGKEDPEPVQSKSPAAGGSPGPSDAGGKTDTSSDADRTQTGANGFARLSVTVVKAQDLMGMDVAGLNSDLSIHRTLDACVKLAINDKESFGQTKVVWKTKGDPFWDETFVTTLDHPKSYLCLSVWDDDSVFQQGTMLAYLRQCGFLEIPLSMLPRNKTVTGWFTLNHPMQADSGLNVEERQAKLHDAQGVDVDGDGEIDEKPAGQVQLKLRLETTFKEEVKAHMTPAPKFETALPPLAVPQFLNDIFEIKRLLLNRLILAAVGSIMFAISWEKPAISATVLLWYMFLYFYPCYIWATVWFLLLLCFWHEIPEEKEPEDIPPTSPSSASISGGVKGVAQGFGGAVKTFVTKPIEGAKEGGAKGLVKGVGTGLVGGVKEAATGVATGVSNIAGGVKNTVGGLHAPGLNEFQQILMLRPSLRDTVRGFQPTVGGVRGSLQKVDDLFYYGNVQTTKKIVKVVAGLMIASILFASWMSSISWYLFLLLGMAVISMKSSGFKLLLGVPLAVLAAKTRPQEAFQGCQWFEVDS